MTHARITEHSHRWWYVAALIHVHVPQLFCCFDATATWRKREENAKKTGKKYYRGANGCSRREFRRKNFPAFRWIDWRSDEVGTERRLSRWQEFPSTIPVVPPQPGRLKGLSVQPSSRARKPLGPMPYDFAERYATDRSRRAVTQF